MDRKTGALAVVATLVLLAPAPVVRGQQPDPLGTGTFSILGYDPATGELGAAVQSRVFSVGNGVLWGEAGVGIAASVLLAVALLIGANLFYLGSKFTDIRPLPYLLGAESRDEFLSRQVGSYPATAYINRNLPDDAVVEIPARIDRSRSFGWP